MRQSSGPLSRWVLKTCEDSLHNTCTSFSRVHRMDYGTSVGSLTRATRVFPPRAYSTSAGTNLSTLRKARLYSPGIGMIAGLFGSMIGVGGGVIMNPMILNICKSMPQRIITGTSLGAVLSTALASGSMFATSDCVDIPSAILIATSSMVMAPLGARLTARMNCSQLRRVLGYFLFAASPLVPLKTLYARTESAEGRVETQDVVQSLKSLPWSTVVQMLTIGSVAGISSGLLGIGGGTIVTPMLAITTQLDHSVVLGTSLVSMVPPAATGLIQHYRMGNVDWRLCLGLVLGTSVGGALGSNIALQAPPGALEGLFSLGMIFLGRKTLASAR